MLICSSLDEMRRRESALRFIATLVVDKGRSELFDLSGLAGGFPLDKCDLGLLETYAGPAIFEKALEKEGLKHLGGEKVLAFNRTSSGILAAILALIKPGDEVLHYLPKLPSHPSIPRSCKLRGASYREYDNINEFKVSDRSKLVVITGSTMDHQVLSQSDFELIIKRSMEEKVPVLVDDASGARIRTVIYNQPRAMDMGADLVITSTDKLMDGPRGGLMSGKAYLIDLLKTKAHQFGLEAQPPLIAGMVRALENFNPERIQQAVQRKDILYRKMRNVFKGVEKTPTGFMISPSSLMDEIINNNSYNSDACDFISPEEAATLLAMIMLKDHGYVTIPAVGMPGASPTIRIDLASSDAQRLEDDGIILVFQKSMRILKKLICDEESCLSVLYE